MDEKELREEIKRALENGNNVIIVKPCWKCIEIALGNHNLYGTNAEDAIIELGRLPDVIPGESDNYDYYSGEMSTKKITQISQMVEKRIRELVPEYKYDFKYGHQ